MKQVYVVIWEDRHTDTGVYVFSDQEKAIAWAKEQAHECDRHGDLDETNPAPNDWLYYGCYSCEGDHLRVVPRTIDYLAN